MTREEFLDSFFGDGNGLDRADVESNPDLSELAGDLTDGLPRPVVLPRRVPGRNVIEWFVLCRDEPMLRRAQGEVQGFVGPSYARWEGVRATLDPSDPVEAAVARLTGGSAIRFLTGSGEHGACWSAVKLMREVWAQRPRPRPVAARSGAARLREFELAIAGGDTATAGVIAAELRRRGLVSDENLRFMEIRRLAAEGRWKTIAALPDLEDIARIRRPWLVTEALLTALYRTRLAPLERRGEAAAAVAAAAILVDELPGLFASRGPLRGDDVVKAFALRYATPAGRDVERLRALREVQGLERETRDWIDVLLAEVAATAVPESAQADVPGRLVAAPPPSGLDRDAAFEEALAQRPSAQRTSALLMHAVELQTLEAARQAVEALDELGGDEREQVLESRMVVLAVEGLQRLVEPARDAERSVAAPAMWSAWLERLVEDNGWRAAEAVAVCGELEFAAQDVLEPQSAVRLGELLGRAADSDARQTVRHALPRLVRWLERQPAADAFAAPVHLAVLTVLALDESRGAMALEVAYAAVEALLDGGVTDAAYSEMTDSLSLLWKQSAAPVHAMWLADLVELLDLHPGPSDVSRLFADEAVRRLLPHSDRIGRVALASLARSCTSFGADDLARALQAHVGEEPLIDAAAGVRSDALDGRIVGIYTLTPQVATHARDAIERMFTGVEVKIDASHVSTASLEHLARTADYLIVSLRSAKHAATDAIDAHRPATLPTIHPSGRGSSRMVEALVAELSGTRPSTRRPGW